MSVTVLLAAAGLAAAGVMVWRRPRRRLRRGRRLPPSYQPLDLADLKAESQRRVESMRSCRLSLVQATREGEWLRLVIRVKPPAAETRWWPSGISLECPQQLALRDAATQGPPLQGALTKKLEGYAPDDWRQGDADLVLRVCPPSGCVCLEIGYYGAPAALIQLSSCSDPAEDH